MKVKATILAAALAAASLLASPASAAPVGPIQKGLATERMNLQTVDYRPYRHCHRNKWGRKWCHGGKHRRHGYYRSGPSFGVYIGRGHRHHHHHHRHHRRWR
jgi:hypothetical protein